MLTQSFLFGLPMLTGGRSRAVNAENPRGEKGGGGKAASHLGPSRKGSPCLRLPMGNTVVLADIDGPGVITHIWITVTDRSEKNNFVLRDLVLRMYWEGEDTPAVESPLGDFFCCGFGADCAFSSLPMVVNPTRGFNVFFPMPFRRHARITIENQHETDIDAFFYQIDYCLYDALPDEMAYFCASWRRERLTTPQNDYTILDHVKGPGRFVGAYIGLTTLERYWWGEGEMKFYIDGDDQYPTICGTGMEDYFGGAWSFAAQKDGRTVEQQYATPFMGYPYHSAQDTLTAAYYENDCPPMRGFYRWHLLDPILFQEDLRVTIQQIGVNVRGLFERQDDLCSVAYWYQASPKTCFPPLPDKVSRWPR